MYDEIKNAVDKYKSEVDGLTQEDELSFITGYVARMTETKEMETSEVEDVMKFLDEVNPTDFDIAFSNYRKKKKS